MKKWSVISLFSNLHRWSNSLGLFCHVPLKRDQGEWDWRLRLSDTPDATDCIRIYVVLSRYQNAPIYMYIYVIHCQCIQRYICNLHIYVYLLLRRYQNAPIYMYIYIIDCRCIQRDICNIHIYVYIYYWIGIRMLQFTCTYI